MLRVPFYAQEGEKRVVEIESPARRTADCRRQNDAGGTESVSMPRALEDKFRKQRGAWANYEKFPPGYRRVTAGWVASAKKEETQMKRLQKLMEFSARNERIEFM